MSLRRGIGADHPVVCPQASVHGLCGSAAIHATRTVCHAHVLPGRAPLASRAKFTPQLLSLRLQLVSTIPARHISPHISQRLAPCEKKHYLIHNCKKIYMMTIAFWSFSFPNSFLLFGNRLIFATKMRCYCFSNNFCNFLCTCIFYLQRSAFAFESLIIPIRIIRSNLNFYASF